MQGAWETQTGKYQWGEDFRIGRIVVASAHHVSGSRDEPTKFGVTIHLPGIRSPTDRYTSLEDAKARAERAVNVWFSWLEQKP